MYQNPKLKSRSTPLNTEETVNYILSIFQHHHRPVANEKSSEPFPASVKNKLRYYINKQQPITLLTPGFPFKSISRTKTLGPNPDKADRESIKHLNRIADQIKEVYSPGAVMLTYSDGGVFEGMLLPGYTASQRAIYQAGIRKIISETGREKTFKYIPSDGLDLRHKAESKESLAKRVKNPVTANDRDMKDYHKGVTIFWQNELNMISKEHRENGEKALSRKQNRSLAEDFAYDMIRISIAYLQHIKEKNPHAICCLPHAFPKKTGDVSIWYNANRQPGLAWHNSLARVHRGSTKRPETFSMMHAHDAKNLGLYAVKDKEGNPSHFDIPPALNRSVTNLQRAFRSGRERRHGSAENYNPQKQTISSLGR